MELKCNIASDLLEQIFLECFHLRFLFTQEIVQATPGI